MSPKQASESAAELAALPSLGDTSAHMLIEAGVPDVATLRGLGPLESYRRLRFHFGKRITTNFIYALECACRGLDWRLLDSARKAELRRDATAIAESLTRRAHG